MLTESSALATATEQQQRRVSRRDRGAALVLLPACFLIVIGLSAVAVDGAVMHAAQRRLAAVCAAAADDAAGMIDGRALHTTGDLRIDVAAATRVARARLAPRFLPGVPDRQPIITVDPVAGTVDVAAVARLEHLVFRNAPGAQRTVLLHCHSRGRLRR
ncbi:MAG: hypothetical protein ACKOYM_10540 [Actinomycetes bacterium]